MSQNSTKHAHKKVLFCIQKSNTSIMSAAGAAAISYSKISQQEEEEEAAATTAEHGAVSKHQISLESSAHLHVHLNSIQGHNSDFGDGTLRTSTFTHLEQARDLTWLDSFYDGKHGIVAVFDRDVDGAADWFMWRSLKISIWLCGFAILYWILGYLELHDFGDDASSITDDICGVYTIVLAIFIGIMALRARQSMKSQHIAITTEGIRIDNGSMVTITIPFENIHSVEVKPCKYMCSRESGIEQVVVQRAAAPLEQAFCSKTKALELYGIIKSKDFAALVLAMKDSQDNGTYEAASRVELRQIA